MYKYLIFLILLSLLGCASHVVDKQVVSKVIYQLVVAKNGEVESVEILETDIQNQSMLSKIRERLFKVKFNESSEKTTFNYPIEFVGQFELNKDDTKR